MFPDRLLELSRLHMDASLGRFKADGHELWDVTERSKALRRITSRIDPFAPRHARYAA
jgi:hypothetical protein